MQIQNKRLIGIIIAIAVLLLIPVIIRAPWSRFDFLLAGALLLGTGLVCELVLRTVKKTGYRIAVCVAVVIALLIVWAEIAIGVFGTRFAGN